MYGLETCPLKKRILDHWIFIIDRFFVKLFRTINMDTVKLCQEYLLSLNYRVILLSVEH